MKAFLVIFSLVVLVAAIEAAYTEGGVHSRDSSDETKDEAKDEGLSCESKEGCCVDALDCPGCCKPPYDNQCSNLKGIPLNFCEVTGTYFITRINVDPAIFSPAGCASVNIAGNYPEKCQGTLFINSKNTYRGPKGTEKPTYAPFPPSTVDIIRYSSCGHVVVQFSDFSTLPTNFVNYVEPFMLNVAILAKNDAGLALVACYAIDNAPVLLVYILSPTPKPNPWAMTELEEVLEPYYGYSTPNGKLYPVPYNNCYPSLTALNYPYY